MPEHSPLSDADLDRAFDDLVRDVDTVVRPRGAAAAMRTARRRRTVVAGTAAAAVLAVGGIAWAVLPGDGPDDDPGYATGPNEPAPVRFEAADLSKAYGSTWRAGSSPIPTDPICLRPLGAKPVDGDSREFRTEPGDSPSPAHWGAALTHLRYADERTAVRASETLTEGWTLCDVAPTQATTLDLGPDGTGSLAYLVSYPAADGENARDQLVVQSGDAMVLLTVVQDSRPTGDATPIGLGAATALAADLFTDLRAQE